MTESEYLERVNELDEEAQKEQLMIALRWLIIALRSKSAPDRRKRRRRRK